MEFLAVIILAVGIAFTGCAETKPEAPKLPILETTIIEKKEILENESPLLSKPKIAKIKIEPYIDTDGDYHEASNIHIRIEEAKFIEDKKYFSINKD